MAVAASYSSNLRKRILRGPGLIKEFGRQRILCSPYICLYHNRKIKIRGTEDLKLEEGLREQ